MDNRTVNTLFAFNLISLEKENFKQLENFIIDFTNTFFELEDRSWFNFVESVKSELKIFGGKWYSSHKHFVKKEYQQLISKYESLLRELIETGCIFPLYRMMCVDESKNSFLEFYRYLLAHYDNKENISENLNRLEKLNISSFKYNSDMELDGEYCISFRGATDNYSVCGICSDGKKEWLGQKEKGKFPIIIKDANYIISYRKNTLSFDKVELFVKNLEFDPNSLPSYQELYDNSVVPFINYDEVERNTLLLCARGDSKSILRDMEKLIENMNAYKEKYYEEFLMDSDLNTIDRQIINYEEQSLYWKVLGEEICYKPKERIKKKD